MTPTRVLVTGTDTEVGKTFISRALLTALQRADIDAIGIKPVESGCDPDNESAQDGVQLARASGQSAPRRALDRLRAPVAPPVAADAEDRSLSFDSWCTQIHELSQAHRLTIVEGAGGLMSPMTWTHTALDLASELSMAAIVVAADRLGALNSTLLSLDALRQRRIPILGVIFNAPAHPDQTTGKNASALQRFTGMTTILTTPRAAGPAAAESALQPALEWLAP